MSRTVKLLVSLLAIQCGLLAYAFWPAIRVETSRPGAPPAFLPDNLREIAVSDSFDNLALLAKRGDRWVLPGLGMLPANEQQVESLLKGLSAEENPWPVARTSTAHRRMEVTESQYEMFKRYEIGAEEIAILKEHCDKRNIIFHCTPTNTEGLQDLVKAGVPVLKNGSDYLSHVKS